MKIAWTTYSFAGLPGTARRLVSTLAGNDRPVAAGISLASVRFGTAALRCLHAIEEMASEIMNITGDGLPAEVDECPGQVPVDASGSSTVERGDVLVFFPGATSGREGEDGRREFIVVKGMGRPGGAGLLEEPQEEALETLARDVAQVLARSGRGLGSGVPGQDPPRVREKFIISIDAVDGMPVPSVVRHDPSGEATVLTNGRGELPEGAVPSQVAAIAGLLTDAEEGVPVEHLQRAWGAFSDEAEISGCQETDGMETEETVRPAARSFLSDPVAAIRDMGRTVQHFFSVREDAGRETKAEVVQDHPTLPSGVEGAAVPAGELPEVNVTLMGHAAPAVQSGAGCARMVAQRIVEKVAVFSDAVNGMITGSSPDADSQGDNADEAVEGYVPMKEAMKRAVAASFAGVVEGPAGMDGPESSRLFGISLDEKGLLRVDTGVLCDALSGGKGEAVRFVHDLTASLHDRITYNALAFASLHARVEETVPGVPSGREPASGEDTDRKAHFEKRLNELQMLLKSSYELKDSFMRKSGGWLK